VDEDPGHILEVIEEAKDLATAAEKLGCTPEYLQSVVDRFEPASVDVEAFPLAAGEAIPTQQLPAWLTKPLPKKTRGRWPGGAKSPSWFKRISQCARNHSQRYRHKRPDPSGLDAIVGNALHGAFQDAARIRMAKRRGAPAHAGQEELLFHLEKQPEVVHDRGTEVLKRCRRVIEDMEAPLELSNVWAAEFVWSFNASAGFLIAGIADLILVDLHPHNPNGAPELVVVVDYKTGPAQVPSQEDLRSDPQACLELIWARRYFHNAKRVQFKIWNVGQNQQVTIDWDHEIERSTLSFVRACWHVWTQGTETANVTPACRWCPYRSDCKAYTQTLNAEAYRAKDSLEEKELDELVEIHYRARMVADLADTRRKDAAALILGKLAPGQTKYRSHRFLVLRKTRKNESFPSVSDLLFQISEAAGINLGRIMDACTSIGPQKIKTWLKTLPKEKHELASKVVEAHRQRRSSPPWVEVREKDALF
jgi:RecB family exonuclease